MKDREKGLAELVMYCIHIDSHHEVIDAFREYYSFVDKLGIKKNVDLYNKVWLKYEVYILNKIGFGEDEEWMNQ